jgi:thioredoxin family protein
MRHEVTILLALAAPVFAAEPDAQPRELGSVHFGRRLDDALAASKSSGKPVLVVFQEIPGCGTCVGFGQRVLSHPLLADAIESEFVPLAIHNNKGGHDGEVLKQYAEPAWNNPVMRFLDASGKDVIPRRDGVFDAGEIGARMIEALEAAKRPVPAYLRLAVDELSPRSPETATFAMSCFWEGESQLGGIDGVLATRTGYLDGHEVVEVTFDSAKVSMAELTKKASAIGCATNVYATSDAQLDAAKAVAGERARKASGSARDAARTDRKVYLNRSPLRFLPLTPMQASRINSALRFGRDASELLGPRERALASQIDRALAANADALDGLSRPDALPDLAAYEASLRERLGR